LRTQNSSCCLKMLCHRLNHLTIVMDHWSWEYIHFLRDMDLLTSASSRDLRYIVSMCGSTVILTHYNHHHSQY
jgi:hypothetical protein